MFLTVKDVCDRLGVPRHRVKWAWDCGAVPRPLSVLGRLALTESDVKLLADYFALRAKSEGKRTVLLAASLPSDK